MYLLLLGLILLAMKYFGVSPVASWSWISVLAPFAMAVVWWAFADWSGYTKRQTLRKEEKLALKRKAKIRENLGLTPPRK